MDRSDGKSQRDHYHCDRLLTSLGPVSATETCYHNYALYRDRDIRCPDEYNPKGIGVSRQEKL